MSTTGEDNQKSGGNEEAFKKPVGRPSIFTRGMEAAAIEYLQGFDKLNQLVPSAAGLALHLKVARSTIYKWADENSTFSDILQDIQATQETLLLNGALGNKFNANIAKLMLGKHGYKESKETELTGNLTVDRLVYAPDDPV